jgi:hypothetical protein
LNLENSPEESRIPVGEVNLTRDETSVQPQNPAAALDDIVSGKISLHPGWRKDVWAKWPGDETIEELLAILEGARLR